MSAGEQEANKQETKETNKQENTNKQQKDKQMRCENIQAVQLRTRETSKLTGLEPIWRYCTGGDPWLGELQFSWLRHSASGAYHG